MSNKLKKIAVIGLGYVGLPLAVAFGKRLETIGFDISHERINQLRAGSDITLELDSSDLRGAKFLTFSDSALEIEGLDVYVITVPTPVDSVNRPDLTPLLNATKTVAKSMRRGSIVIYESTVYPGCTEEVCVPVLEQYSGMKYNVDFYCGYSPERVNPADKVNSLEKVVKVTSGSTPEITDVIDALYAEIITAGTYKAKSIKVAEAAKVIENVQRDLNIAFINELSMIFSRLDIDTMEVLDAASTKWNFLPFLPGLVGGHCIGVDPYYLTHKAEEVGYHPQVILAGRRINDDMAHYAANSIIRLMVKNGIDIARSRIGVLGMTFKENCPDIRNSKVVDLIKELKTWGASICVADCFADPIGVYEEYGIELKKLSDLSELDALVIAVGHSDYRSIPCSELKRLFRSENPVLADLKAIYSRKESIDSGFTVFRL